MDDGFVQTFEVEQQIGNNVVRTVCDGQHRRRAPRA